MNKFINTLRSNRKMRHAALAAGLLALVVISYLFRTGGREDGNTVLTATVNRGPLTITLEESGTIQNSQSAVVRSQVEGNATILYLAPEGAQVKTGDLLVELDSSKLVENLARQQITVMNNEASFIQARENLAVVRNQGESDIAKADLAHQFAVQDLRKYQEGEHPRELQKAEAEINIAREELQRANDKLEWSERLAEEGYVTRTELQADALSAKRTQINLALAESAMDLLKNYSYQRTLDQLQSDVEQTRQALERVRIKAASDLIQAETQLKTRESEYRRQTTQLEKIEDQIAKCSIHAPVDGMVVYATTRRGRYSSGEPLEEGQQVRERQDLIHLPTDDAMMAEIRVHEASLRKVSMDMPVRITVDAIPDAIFHGRISRIAFLPDSQSAWMNPDLKVYATQIKIDDKASSLRPGMGCRAEIIVAEYADALYIPVQCVVRVDGQTVVYVPGPQGIQTQPVSTGLDNNRMIHILEGLQEGEQVVLAPPLAPSTVKSGEQENDPEPSDNSKAEPPAPTARPPRDAAQAGGVRGAQPGRKTP